MVAKRSRDGGAWISRRWALYYLDRQITEVAEAYQYNEVENPINWLGVVQSAILSLPKNNVLCHVFKPSFTECLYFL